jgi:uncharacterized protein
MIRFAFSLLLLFYADSVSAQDIVFGRDIITIEKTGGSRDVFSVEMALTGPQQEQGLMYRTALEEGSGMLFVFDRTQRLSFWMKNTLIPLDLLFIGPDGTIRHIHRNAVPLDESGIPSRHPARAVLELAGGQCARRGIKEGDKVLHPVFGNMLAP